MYILRLLFSPKGKIARTDFLIGEILTIVLIAILVIGPFLLLFTTVYIPSTNNHLNIFNQPPALIFFLLFMLFNYCGIICLAGKRLRDIGLSPLWVLVIYTFLIPLIFAFLHRHPPINIHVLQESSKFWISVNPLLIFFRWVPFLFYMSLFFIPGKKQPLQVTKNA